MQRGRAAHQKIREEQAKRDSDGLHREFRLEIEACREGGHGEVGTAWDTFSNRTCVDDVDGRDCEEVRGALANEDAREPAHFCVLHVHEAKCVLPENLRVSEAETRREASYSHEGDGDHRVQQQG